MRSRDIISEATRADSRPTRGWSQEACMIGLCDLCLFGAARALRAPARGTGRGTTAALYVPILSIPIGHRSGMYRVSAIYLTSLVADFAWTGGTAYAMYAVIRPLRSCSSFRISRAGTPVPAMTYWSTYYSVWVTYCTYTNGSRIERDSLRIVANSRFLGLVSFPMFLVLATGTEGRNAKPAGAARNGTRKDPGIGVEERLCQAMRVPKRALRRH